LDLKSPEQWNVRAAPNVSRCDLADMEVEEKGCKQLVKVNAIEVRRNTRNKK